MPPSSIELFTVHYYLFPASACAPRPWGMQPNTSLRLRMCISPLMFRLDIIPFSPCPSPLLRINCAKTGLTFFLKIISCRKETSPARRRRTPRPPPSTRQRIFQLKASQCRKVGDGDMRHETRDERDVRRKTQD